MRRLAALALVVMLSGCSWLYYPRLGISQPITTGGQAELDAGNVTRVDLPGIWLAGHRTSHGAVFAALPAAQPGDQVCAYGICYRVERLTTLPLHQIITFPYLGPLVLQTSLDYSTALIVVAVKGA